MGRPLASRLARLEDARPTKAVVFDSAKHSEGHPKQLAFVSSTAKRRTACCSRRAGKSEGAAGILLDTALAKPGCVALYMTRTRVNAKRIIWEPLKRINREHRLGGRVLEADLAIVFGNGSRIYLIGADNRDELDKARGMGLGVVVVDEAQLLVGQLEQLIDEVLSPALMDYDGPLVLVGTPAPVPAGYFWECLHGKHSRAWERHEWTVFDNPWVERKSGKRPAQHLDEEMQRRGVDASDPKIQREYFAKWAYDPNSLVFRYDAGLNHFEELPTVRGEWACVLGVDLGHDDADAIGALEWNSTLPNLWLTEESVLPKQTITQLGDRLREMVNRKQPMAVVVDTGGLGKKIAEELTARWGLKVEAAEKERKLEHIELLNDALRSGRFFAKKGSRFAQDAMLVEWDKSNPEKWRVGERYHSDIADGVLYGFRRAKQWLSEPEPAPLPPHGSAEWQEKQRQQWVADGEAMRDTALEQAILEKSEREEWESYE